MNAEEWQEIRQSYYNGESIKGVAHRLGISRNTVRRALKLSEPPEDHRRLRGSIAEDVDDLIRDFLSLEPGITIAEIARRIAWEHSRTLLSRRVHRVKAEIGASTMMSTLGSGVPRQSTSFVGREKELRELRGLLGDYRLVTILGPGGAGKTRLAAQAAKEFKRAFRDGIKFIEFASLRNDQLVDQIVCGGLGLETEDTAERTATDVLVEYLRNRRMLLVFDNCEHLTEGISELTHRLIEEAAELRIIVTSREQLSIPGEYIHHLQPLATHRSPSAGAVKLFAHRAAAVLTGFNVNESNVEAIQKICKRLDGLPLAIELACLRLSVLSVEDLANSLDEKLSLLTAPTRGRPLRHRSLQATIDWSYELCSPNEQLLWCRLSIFSGGFDLDAAMEVCADDPISQTEIMDLVAALVAKSILLRQTTSSGVRFYLLESMREYGWGKLSTQEQRGMTSLLLKYCAKVVARATDGWYGPQQLAHANAVLMNRGNIRTAMQTVVSNPTDEGLNRLACEVLGEGRYLWACGISMREHRMWLTQALTLSGILPEQKSKVLSVLAFVQTLQGERDTAALTLRRALPVVEEKERSLTHAFATHIAGLKDFFDDDSTSALTNLETAEKAYAGFKQARDLTPMLQAHRGMLLCSIGDIKGAGEQFEEVLRRAEQAGGPWFQSYASYGLGHVAILQADYETAEELAYNALRMQRPFSDTIGKTLMAELLGWSLAGQGHSKRAVVILGAASSMWGSIGKQLYGSKHWSALREQAVTKARAQLSDSSFEALWSSGEAMSTEELLSFVFDEEPTNEDVSDATSRSDDELKDLTPREREVAQMVAEGMTNKHIAEVLVLSPRTVEGHVENVLRKLHLSRRSEVASVLASTGVSTQPE